MSERFSAASAAAAGARLAPMPAGTRLAATTTYDAAARTVELVTATETPVLMPGWMIGLDIDHYYEVLDCSPGAVDLSQVTAGNVPLLDTHNRFELAARLGVVRSAQIETAQVITLVAFGQSDEARGAEAEFAGGTPPKTSVGYRRNEMILDRMDGDVPVYRVSRWTMTEVSLVSIAADPNAGARSATASVSPCTILENTMADQASGAAASAPTQTSTPAPAPTPTPSPAASEATRSATDTTVSRFSGSAALAFVDGARAFGDAVVTRAQDLIQQNERGELSIDGARSALLTAVTDAQRSATGGMATGGSTITVTADERDKFRAGAMNSIIQRAGVAGLISEGARARGVSVDLNPGEFAGIRNAELARMSIERAGQRVDTYDRDAIVGQAMGMRMGPYQATTDFPVILEGVVNRVLQAAYATTPDTWRQFCGIGSVPDFRPVENLLRGTFGELDHVNENGEIKNKPIPDGAKESIKAETKGNIIGLTRQAIVNDDLGVFNDLAVELGRSGKLSIEIAVYRLLALNNGLGPVMKDGKTLFHADHGNIVTPAGPLSIDQIEKMDVLFSGQKDLSGNEFLDLMLHTLLVPRAQRGEALIVNNSEFDTETAGKFQRPNKVRGLFSTVVGSPRLQGTRRYGFADPTVAPALKVVFLNGNQEPRVESKDGWRTDGTEWRVLFDFGVGAVNWRTAITDAGAA